MSSEISHGLHLCAPLLLHLAPFPPTFATLLAVSSLPPGLSLYSPSGSFPFPSVPPSNPACCLRHPAGLLPCCPGNCPPLGSPPLPSPSHHRHQQPPSTFLLFFLRTNRNPVARWNAHLNQPIQSETACPALYGDVRRATPPHRGPPPPTVLSPQPKGETGTLFPKGSGFPFLQLGPPGLVWSVGRTVGWASELGVGMRCD